MKQIVERIWILAIILAIIALVGKLDCWNVIYIFIVSILILSPSYYATQDLYKKIEELQSKIKELKSKIEDLENTK